ncbi:MAG: VOC family protein [Rhodoblastus sp.]
MTIRTTKRSPGEVTWMDLSTPDLVAAKKFYQQVFGWAYQDTGQAFGHYNMAQTQQHNAAGMAQMDSGAQMPSAWTIYFSSDDAAADAQRVKALGGQVLMDAMVVGDTGAMAICADPTGAVFGLWQAKEHIGANIVGEHGSMAWWEVNTRDLVAARDFYNKLFDLTPHKMEGMEYYTMQHGEEMICGVLQMDENWANIPPHWMGYFGVDDTDAAVERATAAGGIVGVPAFDMPYGRMAVIVDPFGAAFSIVQPPQA